MVGVQKREEVSQFNKTWQRFLTSFLGKVLCGVVFYVSVLIFLIPVTYKMPQ
jgi:dolichol kinase